MDLSLIILNYKTKGLLKQCLRGIIGGHLDVEHEVIVVDNDSRDGSVDMVRDDFPTVKIIASPRNVGFGAGMNLGLRVATGRYLLTLNPDVAIFPAAVTTLIDYLDRQSQVGLAAPKLINPDGGTQSSCFMFPHAWIPILRRTPLGKLPWGQAQLRRYLMSDWAHDRSQPVGWVLGACMMIRRQALDKVGYFDDRFFLYFEDVDFCRRFWQAGWQVHYVANAEMVHYHHRLSADYSGLQGVFSYPTRVHIKSGLKYFAKYYGVQPPPHSL